MKLTTAFAQTFAVQVLQSAVSLATVALIARGLGPVGQGVYASLVATVALVAVIGTLGQFQAHVLVSAEAASGPRLLVLAAVAHATLVFLGAILTRPLWGPLVSHDVKLANLFALVLAAEVLAQLVRGINLGQRHIGAFNLVTFAQRITMLIGVATAYRLSIPMTVSEIVALWLVAVGLSAILSAAWIWNRSEFVPLSMRSIGRTWWRVVGHAGRPLVVIVLTLLLIRIDVWMLRPMLGAAAVGQLSVANGLAEWLWYVPSILNNLLFAAVAADTGTGAVAQVAQASRLITTITVPAAIVLLIGGRTLVELIYGPAFAPAGLLFVALVPGVAALAIHLVIDAYFAGTGFPPITVITAAAALIAKVLLNFALVPRWSTLGAAIATSLVYMGMLSVKLMALSRVRRATASDLLLLRRSDVTAAMAAVRAWGHPSSQQ